MTKTLKISLASLIVALALASAVGTASANRLSTSGQTFRAVWTPLTFSSAEEGGIQIRCNVTLEGTFHTTTITKETRLIGYITSVAVAHPCEGFGEAFAYNGTERILGTTLGTSLPWHLTYEGFTGTLPNITSLLVLLTGVKFQLVGGGLICSATYGGGRTPSNARGIANVEAGGTTIRAEERTAIPRTAGSIVCPAQGFFSGTSGGVTTPGGTAIRITLI